MKPDEVYKLAKCTDCTLFKSLRDIVPGDGPTTAKIMLIGEAPGKDEIKMQRPFVGESGILLTKACNQINLVRGECYITNVGKCLPLSGTGAPPASAVKCCYDVLEKEIETVKPRVIGVIGNAAVNRLLGKRKGVTQISGQAYWSDKYNAKIVPIIHPAAILRHPGWRRLLMRGLEAVLEQSRFPEFRPPIKKPVKYLFAITIEQVEKVIKKLHEVTEFSCDIETTGFAFRKDEILCISFSWQEYFAVVIPFFKKDLVPVWTEEQNKYVWNLVKGVMANPVGKIFHNGKFDTKFFLYRKMLVNNFNFDTMLSSYLLDEESSHELKDLLLLNTDMGEYDAELDSLKPKNNKDFNYSMFPHEKLWYYACADADGTFRLKQQQVPLMEEEGVDWLFENLAIPLTKMLTLMELRGVKVDLEYVAELVKIYDKRRGELLNEVHQDPDVRRFDSKLQEEAKEKTRAHYREGKVLQKKYTEEAYLIKMTPQVQFNIRSGPQMQRFLYRELKLPVLKKTDTGQASTDAEVLEQLSSQSTFIRKLLEFRDVDHKLTTYLMPLPGLADENHRIHTNYSDHTTVTGRLSSSEPNLQNLHRDDLEIRNCYIAQDEFVLVDVDFKQVEFRCLAEYSRDAKMLEEIRAGVDIHRQMGSIVFDIPPEQVTSKQRSNIKGVVFGIMYGRGAKSVAEEYGITVDEAQRILNLFFGRYPDAKKWVDQQKITVRREQRVKNRFGRVRRLPGIGSNRDGDVAEAERQAVNSPIQSLASDVNLITLIRCYSKFRGKPIYPVMTTHDDFACETKPEVIPEMITIVKDDVASGYPFLEVNFDVDIKIGKRYGDMYELHTINQFFDFVC